MTGENATTVTTETQAFVGASTVEDQGARSTTVSSNTLAAKTVSTRRQSGSVVVRITPQPVREKTPTE